MSWRASTTDARSVARSFGARVYDGGDPAPLLRWTEAWRDARGAGQCLGLLDSAIATPVRDLVRADVVVRDFAGGRRAHRRILEHGTHSATLLVGQGRYCIHGFVPRARLRIASVVGPGGVATPAACANGVRWLVSAGARVIAIPLGDSVDRDELAREIEDADRAGVIVFAAAGNYHPGPLAFPARHGATIAVGAADRIGRLLDECSRTPRLDLIAPGHSVRALVRDGVVRRRRGTSVACVVAAGVATLALSAGAITGEITRSRVLAILRRGGWPH